MHDTETIRHSGASRDGWDTPADAWSQGRSEYSEATYTKPFSDAWNNIPPNNFPLTPSFNDGRKQGVRSAAYVCPWAVAPGLPLAQVEDATG
jgi:hypothetical protein